jgi:hypothetical protein
VYFHVLYFSIVVALGVYRDAILINVFKEDHGKPGANDSCLYSLLLVRLRLEG